MPQLPWLKELKFAILDDDHDSIIQLTQEIPPLSLEEMITAKDLIQETIKECHIEKDLAHEMLMKIKKQREFLKQEEHHRLTVMS